MNHEYLTWQSIRLSPSKEWRNSSQGLTFVFPKQGFIRFVSGSMNRNLFPGDVLVVDNVQKALMALSQDGEVTFGFFSACMEHLFPLFHSNEIALLQNVTDGFRTIKIYPHTSPLATKCHQLLEEVTPDLDLNHRSQLLRIVAAVLSEEFKLVRPGSESLDEPVPPVVQAFNKLSANELLELSVDDLAAKLNCSRRHLSRLFRQHFGFSVVSLKMELRLFKAISLLRDPSAKVINVAEESGFYHQGLFNTYFKRRFGLSPSQWRKTASQSRNSSSTPIKENEPPLLKKGNFSLNGPILNSDTPIARAAVQLLENEAKKVAAQGRPTGANRKTTWK